MGNINIFRKTSVTFLLQKINDLPIIRCSSRELESLSCKKLFVYLNIYSNVSVPILNYYFT